MGRNLCYSLILVFTLMGEVQLSSSIRFSASFTRLLYALNGEFSTKIETVDKYGHHLVTIASVSYIPIHVHSIQGPAILYRETYPVHRNFILELLQDLLGIIHIKLYKVGEKAAKKSVSRSPARLPAQAWMEPVTKCVPITKEVGQALFLGNWVDCTRTVDGLNPVYLFRVTCDDVTVTISTGLTTHEFQYKLQGGQRHPFPLNIKNAMEGTENPCVPHHEKSYHHD